MNPVTKLILTISAVLLLLGIMGFFGTEFILLSALIALAIGTLVLPSALGLTKKEDSYYGSEP